MTSQLPKSITIPWHAGSRLLNRFNIHYTDEVMCDVIRQIQEQEAMFLFKQTNYKSVWIVKINNRHIKAVYDKKRHTILTFLPK